MLHLAIPRVCVYLKHVWMMLHLVLTYYIFPPLEPELSLQGRHLARDGVALTLFPRAWQGCTRHGSLRGPDMMRLLPSPAMTKGIFLCLTAVIGPRCLAFIGKNGLGY